ncbi:histidine phosphatase family protein [Micromonospora cathayae]|uniref:Histidine phosphatase family protein n=1 Tax=Micromonospora cathayae TaxID=3028804 RepID=A0ABY7ZMX5_9ACTN|nr:histidine phosphatase family protein [Micromonospora sp. HUAS 3]WDZ84223.1 histidine phosphatase family protein [Micromonospora sp. HUAS 3]
MPGRYLHLARHGEAVDDGPLSPAGREQARLLGRRMVELPITAVHHSPLPRATQTAHLAAEALPGVPVRPCDLLTDHVPPVPDRSALPEVYARFLDGLPAEDAARGASLSAAAIDRYAVPAVDDTDVHELIVTHNFVIGWFVRHALEAPVGRWLGLNQANAALTTICYRRDRPPTLVRFNELGHLPAALRWTGFPPDRHV